VRAVGLSLAGGASSGAQPDLAPPGGGLEAAGISGRSRNSRRGFIALTGDLPARQSAWSDPALAGNRYAQAFWRQQLQNVRATPPIPGMGAHRQPYRLLRRTGGPPRIGWTMRPGRAGSGRGSDSGKTALAVGAGLDAMIGSRTPCRPERLGLSRPGAAADRGVLLPAGAGGAAAELHRFRHLRAGRSAIGCALSVSPITCNCCKARCSGPRSATPCISWWWAVRCRWRCRWARRCW
jgi:hypothetical protein